MIDHHHLFIYNSNFIAVSLFYIFFSFHFKNQLIFMSITNKQKKITKHKHLNLNDFCLDTNYIEPHRHPLCPKHKFFDYIRVFI